MKRGKLELRSQRGAKSLCTSILFYTWEHTRQSMPFPCTELRLSYSPMKKSYGNLMDQEPRMILHTLQAEGLSSTNNDRVNSWNSNLEEIYVKHWQWGSINLSKMKLFSPVCSFEKDMLFLKTSFPRSEL